MKLNQIIFPHIDNRNQRKELQYMYCYNIFLLEFRKVQDDDYKEYQKSLIELINSNINSGLVGNEDALGNFKDSVKNQIFRESGGNSAMFNVKIISKEEKNNIDSYLITSGWPKKIDPYGYVVEGCVHDDLKFIGGKKELYLHYCKFFPLNNLCRKLKKTLTHKSLDRQIEKLFSDPEKSDVFFENMFKNFDDLTENK